MKNTFIRLVSNYGIIHLVWLTFCYLVTRLFYKKCTLIRLPIFIRGRSKISFGSGFISGYFNRIDVFGENGRLIIGDRVQINDNCHIGVIDRVTIGNDVLIASRVFITDHNHGVYSGFSKQSSPFETPLSRLLFSRPVIIESRVWIGEGVIVLPGVRIGEGCVIGAGSVVTKSIPAECVAVGIPAIVVSRYDHDAACWKRI